MFYGKNLVIIGSTALTAFLCSITYDGGKPSIAWPFGVFGIGCVIFHGSAAVTDWGSSGNFHKLASTIAYGASDGLLLCLIPAVTYLKKGEQHAEKYTYLSSFTINNIRKSYCINTLESASYICAAILGSAGALYFGAHGTQDFVPSVN